MGVLGESVSHLSSEVITVLSFNVASFSQFITRKNTLIKLFILLQVST
jgi:hypothetical protein